MTPSQESHRDCIASARDVAHRLLADAAAAAIAAVTHDERSAASAQVREAYNRALRWTHELMLFDGVNP